MSIQNQILQLGRRAFLKNGTLLLAAVSAQPVGGSIWDEPQSLKIGLVTDLHYADKAPAGSRHYRETLQKIEEAASKFKEEKPAFVVELGDLIDAADSVDLETKYLKTINKKFSRLAKSRHYVLGNHCVDTLKKEEFLGIVQQPKSYYSFDHSGFHFVVLDSCFRSDGVAYQRRNFKWTDANIPPEELEWLKADLKENRLPVIVFAHQRLDVETAHGVKNNAAVRKVLESAGNVLGVFQGHSHQNDLKEIGGIHYCTLVAMVEGSGETNNGYSILELGSKGTLKLTGFRQQANRAWRTTPS